MTAQLIHTLASDVDEIIGAMRIGIDAEAIVDEHDRTITYRDGIGNVITIVLDYLAHDTPSTGHLFLVRANVYAHKWDETPRLENRNVRLDNADEVTLAHLIAGLMCSIANSFDAEAVA